MNYQATNDSDSNTNSENSNDDTIDKGTLEEHMEPTTDPATPVVDTEPQDDIPISERPSHTSTVAKNAGSNSEKEGEVPYSILTETEKLVLSLVLAGCGLISSLSMPIYFPILTTMEGIFHVDLEKINMSLVAYLVLQAISPVVASSIADVIGRRPVLLMCLIFATAVNIGLAVCNAYWLLLFLRCLLATAAAPTISITTACVGDWVQRHERGKYIGIVSGFTLIGQGFSPFLGSVIDVWLGWRGIFWFSALVDFVIFLVALFLLPETKRSLVGNLSCPPQRWYLQSPIVYFNRRRLVDTERKTLVVAQDRFSMSIVTEPFKILAQPEIISTLAPSAMMFAAWNTSQTALTNSLGGDYGLSTLKIGLCFFAPGLACMIGSIISGRVVDFFYRKSNDKHKRRYGDLPEAERPPFDLIRARLDIIFIPITIIILAIVGFGWSLKYQINIAPVLVFSFIMTFLIMYPMTCSSTLIVDLVPQKGSVAMSLLNLLRCGLSAIFIACLDKMVAAMNYGGTFTFFAGLIVLFGLFYVYLLRNSGKLTNEMLLRKKGH